MSALLKDKILGIISRESGMDSAKINPEQNFREHSFLDSMQFVAIAARTEEEFGIELPMEVMQVNTLSQFIELVSNQVKKEE